MSEKQDYNEKLIKIGELLASKRKSLGKQYKNREEFIELRSYELFNGAPWISSRHLANIELGKNWISIEKFILLSAALEENPVELFQELVEIYRSNS